MVSDRSITEPAQETVRWFSPHRAVLFGSDAHGQAIEYLDVDLPVCAPEYLEHRDVVHGGNVLYEAGAA
jgi:hypothetical protein